VLKINTRTDIALRPYFTLPITALLLLFFSSCEAFFTYCPLEFLQRQPADLSYEQRLLYAENALASQDVKSMQAAYDSLASIQTIDAQYLAAELSLELSGFPELLLGLISNTVSLYPGSLAEMGSFIDDSGASPDLLISSAEHMRDVMSLGGSIDPMDFVYGSLGLVFEAAPRNPDGSVDLSTPSAVDFAEAIDFMTLGLSQISSLSPTDPMRTFLTTFSDFLNSF
jgi:hypothetical protein